VVKPGEPRAVRVDPSDSAKVRYLAEAGVVGRIDHCTQGWCRIEIGKKQGYVPTSDLWGVGEDEVVD
jgi:SH3-like domain-containing protein